MFAEIFNSKSSLLATTATILLTVWSASKGTMAIGRGLTFMAGKEDSVNYFLRRAIHTLYTLIFCVMLVAVMVIYILAAGFGGEIPTGGYRCEYPVDRQDSICPYGVVWSYDSGILGIAC